MLPTHADQQIHSHYYVVHNAACHCALLTVWQTFLPCHSEVVNITPDGLNVSSNHFWASNPISFHTSTRWAAELLSSASVRSTLLQHAKSRIKDSWHVAELVWWQITPSTPCLWRQSHSWCKIKNNIAFIIHHVTPKAKGQADDPAVSSTGNAEKVNCSGSAPVTDLKRPANQPAKALGCCFRLPQLCS